MLKKSTFTALWRKQTNKNIKSHQQLNTQISVSPLNNIARHLSVVVFLSLGFLAENCCSPVEKFVVDVLGPLDVCTCSINHLNQLLQLFLQSLHCQNIMNNIILDEKTQGTLCKRC